jgi:hypothetical protein
MWMTASMTESIRSRAASAKVSTKPKSGEVCSESFSSIFSASRCNRAAIAIMELRKHFGQGWIGLVVFGVTLDHPKDFSGESKFMLLREVAIWTAIWTDIFLAHDSVRSSLSSLSHLCRLDTVAT